MINTIQINEEILAPSINSEIENKSTTELNKSSSISFISGENSSIINQSEKEKRYKESLIKDEITKGYLIVLLGILSLVTLFGIGFIIIGVDKINKAKKKLNYNL